MATILVVNAGSSSLKFQVFGIEPGQSLKRLIKGQVDGIGNHPRLRAGSSDGASVVDREGGAGVAARLKLPHVIAHAGQALQTAIVVKKMLDRSDVHPLFGDQV